jgi:CBS domain-containing protein
MDYVYVPDKLKQMDSDLSEGKKPSVIVRTLLLWFGNERRGWRVVGEVRAALDSLKMVTSPDFEYQWIDGPVYFQRKPDIAIESAKNVQELQSVVGLQPIPQPQLIDPQAVTLVGGAIEDPTYRIGKLDAANNAPKSVKPDASLKEAVTIMLKDGFSQLPVMTSDRDVKGAVTWRTIATRLALGMKCDVVRDCMDSTVEIIDSDVSLFRVIGLISEQGFILVRDKEKKISGIVTESDLGNSFHQLGRPFLLLSEIENHIRGIIDGKFTVEDLNDVRNPVDMDQQISNVADLSFGQYVRLLQKPERWEKVGLQIDRTTFIKTLERVNTIRNDVMHFDPDGISTDDLEELRKTAKFVQELREIVGK